MKRPNILFLFPDQHRGDWMPYSKEVFNKMGMEELPLRMPNIKRLMDEGTTFTRAVTPSPLCAPARACLASGLRYDNCNVPDNSYNYPLEQKTFYSVLKENGYRVGGVGKFDLNKAVFKWEGDWLDDLQTIGFTDVIDNAGKWDGVGYASQGGNEEPYTRYLAENEMLSVYINDMEERHDLLVHKPTDLPEEGYCDNWIASNGIEMLKSFPENKPWFLQVNYSGPHDPWDITKEMKDRWDDVDFPLPVNWDLDDPEKINGVRQNYAAMLENIDKTIGNFIAELENRGELDNTYIIYSADHGEVLGDFNKFQKRIPERGSVRIPLVVWGPGVEEGVYSDTLVELQDLTATIIELADLSVEEDMPGAEDSISLKPILEGKEIKNRDFQVSALGNWKMISNGKYKLIIEEENSEDGECIEKIRLYDLERDPWEEKNIAKIREDIVRRLREKLKHYLDENSD